MVHIYDQVVEGNFSENETGQSSMWRELKDTLNVMKSYVNILRGNTVKHRTDVQDVVRALSMEIRQIIYMLLLSIFSNFALRITYSYFQSGSLGP